MLRSLRVDIDAKAPDLRVRSFIFSAEDSSGPTLSDEACLGPNIIRRSMPLAKHYQTKHASRQTLSDEASLDQRQQLNFDNSRAKEKDHFSFAVIAFLIHYWYNITILDAKPANKREQPVQRASQINTTYPAVKDYQSNNTYPTVKL